jgi:electron transfer flavoprotein beta subunit
MNIITTVNFVPDLVEELAIDDSGAALDMTWLRLILNEFDDHAIEQAILLKESGGGQVTVIAPDREGVDDALFTAAAKGADRLIKLMGDFEEGMNNHALARVFAPVVKELQPDLVLTGVQAHDDLDGQVGPLMAELLGLPYVGYIAGLSLEGNVARVKKEYPGGLIADMEVKLPAVIGIQASEEPPRYVAFSKIKQSMGTATIEELESGEFDFTGGSKVDRMFQPEVAEKAEMLEGDESEIAEKLLDIFKEHGVL